MCGLLLTLTNFPRHGGVQRLAMEKGELSQLPDISLCFIIFLGQRSLDKHPLRWWKSHEMVRLVGLGWSGPFFRDQKVAYLNIHWKNPCFSSRMILSHSPSIFLFSRLHPCVNPGPIWENMVWISADWNCIIRSWNRELLIASYLDMFFSFLQFSRAIWQELRPWEDCGLP